MEQSDIDLGKMRVNLSRETFSEILDGLPSMFRFRLINIKKDFKDFDGYWEKTIKAGKPVWHKDGKYLSSYSFFEFKEQILDAIEKERGAYYKINGNWQALKPIIVNNGTKQIVTRKKGDITQILTKEKLKWLYYRENKSLEDIAKEYGCSRPTIMNIMKKYGLIRRGRSKARIEAIKKGKFDGFEYHTIDEKFFGEWSPEMAWVLGLLFTDGTIDNTRVAIYSVDIDLLEKIKTLLKSTKPVQKRTQSYDKTKHIYEFGFYREKMRDDLFKLGLQERKSLIMVFPDIPEEYMRHFIRGCWDGDGSIFFDKNRLVASYISGSKKFIERLVEELYKIGICKRDPFHIYKKTGERILIPITDEMNSKYQDGRLPLIIFRDKRANAYYIKVRGKENIDKLFHYFYDGADESMYLTRKYNVFVKGLNLEKIDETEQLTLDLDF
jgi:hypothetical protein